MTTMTVVPNADLAAYIETQRANGLSDDVIRHAVLTAGWSEELVAEAFSPPTAPSDSPAAPPISTPSEHAPAATTTPQVLHSTLQTTHPDSDPVPTVRKIAAGLLWLTAAVFSFHAAISTIILYIIANSLRSAGLTLTLLTSTTMLMQQPFILAAIATMLFWLGRGMWVGVRKLALLGLVVLVIGVAAWVGINLVLATEFARATGSISMTSQLTPSSYADLSRILLSPVVLLSAVAFLATIIAFSQTSSERQGISLKAKLILGSISTLVLGSAIAITLLVTVWGADRNMGLKELQPTLNYTVHTLPTQSEFVMALKWSLAKSQPNEPSPSVQSGAFPKADVTASPSAQRTITIRQYPKTPDVSPVRALNFDPQGQVLNPKQVPLKSGTMAVVTEKQFGQGKITTLAFEASDGVMIRLTSIRAQLPEIIQLADELNQTPPQK